ncbi:MAG: hypothetical protein HY259_11130 [Chloroflexi bacterium]|nr:hypothetical protein [Chloroflexota bacterium]
MNTKYQPYAVIALLALLFVIALAACATPAVSPATGASNNAPPAAAQPASQAQAAPPSAGQPKSLADMPLNRTKFPNGSLKTSDEISYVGRSVKIQGAGYTPGAKLDLVWATFDGKFKLGEQLEFYNHEFVERNVPIASAQADDAGKFSLDFVVPEDYGGVHNIYALSGGEKVMQAGLNVRTEYFVSPLSGPVGTPIHIKVTGIGYAKWEESRNVAYDNQFTGLLVGILNKGTAEATIRATGGLGNHNVRVGSGGAQMPYLNVQQAPVYFPGRIQDFTFKVTSLEPDPASIELQTEWQGRSYADLNANPGAVGAKGERLTVTPNVATVGAPLKVTASGFAPNTTIELQWQAMRGNRNSGWAAQSFPLDKITTDANGKFEREVKMPDDLGGSHALIALVNGQKVADATAIIEPSILSMSPRSGPAGTDIKIVLKGVGWTEVDNVYIMNYDNAIAGYACGFNSVGDVTINIKATGAPGWHYIDFYPSIYIGHAEAPWIPDVPWLSFKSHPGLPKPAMHLAFLVTP